MLIGPRTAINENVECYKHVYDTLVKVGLEDEISASEPETEFRDTMIYMWGVMRGGRFG